MYRQKNKNIACSMLPVDVCLYDIILYRACILTKINITVWKFSRQALTTHTLYRARYLYIWSENLENFPRRKSSPIYYSELSLDDRVSFFLCPVWKYRIRLLWRLGKVWRLWRGKDYYHTTITTLSNTKLNSYNLGLRICTAALLKYTQCTSSTYYIKILIFGIFISR